MTMAERWNPGLRGSRRQAALHRLMCRRPRWPRSGLTLELDLHHDDRSLPHLVASASSTAIAQMHTHEDLELCRRPLDRQQQAHPAQSKGMLDDGISVSESECCKAPDD